MTEPATASQPVSPEVERWDAFIGWARRFAEWDQWDGWERNYKLKVGANLQAARDAVLGDAPNWLDALDRAFGSGINLATWQFKDVFLKWCRGDPSLAASALKVLWDPSATVAKRIDGFLDIVPQTARKSPAGDASFLHMAMEPTRFPLFRRDPVILALELTGHPNSQSVGNRSPGAHYEHFLAFLDRILAEASSRGLTLRDRLDAQSVVWSIKRHLPPDWSESDRRALQAYRGDAVADEQADTAHSNSETVEPDKIGKLPDVPRSVLLEALARFDAELRDTDDWARWEQNGTYKYAIAYDGRRYPVKQVVSLATGVPTTGFSGGSEANQYVTDRGLTVVPIHPTDRPHTWWVNQGGSYAQERDGGYLWAPLLGKDGRTFPHWKNMERLRPGDIVLHYANSALRAVSQVQAEAVQAPRPTTAEADPTAADGYLVMTAYYEFTAPLPLADIPQAWRHGESGPFTKLGTINQGYLFPVPAVLVAWMVERFPGHWPDFVIKAVEGVETEQDGNGLVSMIAPVRDGQPPDEDYVAPHFAKIVAQIGEQGLRIAERTLRRYHLSLATRGFVILAGPSGTGKTWLAEAYADAVGARHALVSVAPNWTTNEDLLGYFNPLSGQYHDTAFSRFLRDAAHAYAQASAAGRTPRPYHLVLDEMNLARVEYYFAAFLSAMEVRARHGTALLALGSEESVLLPPSLSVIGTVNVDETTHGFADKVYDRAQLVELDLRREDLALHMGDAVYQEALLDIWDAVADVGPFAFRVLDEVAAYVDGAEELDVPWEEAVDEQLVQKVLPKLKGADPAVGTALERFTAATVDHFPLSHARAAAMLEGFRQHGFASYFH